MTAADRAFLKRQVDAHRRSAVAGERAFDCQLCGAPLPVDAAVDRRKFCTEAHRKNFQNRYGSLPMRVVRPLPVRDSTLSAPGRARYATDEERLEARRETWRKNRRRQYDLYRRLTSELGEKRSQRWGSHLAELRQKVAA